MTAAEPLPTAQVRIDHESAVHLAATVARDTALRCGLEGARPDSAAAVASELASNLHKHARDGAVYVQPLTLGQGLEIVAVDRGPGMADLRQCLADGYTTTGTLGTGLGAVRRVADDFVIRSRTGYGTAASARIAATARAAGTEAAGTGAVCLPADGETECGDACAVRDTDSGRTAVVVDGLGHGEPAARAARTALRAFDSACAAPLPDIMRTLHRALRHTRGAAVGLLRLLPGRAEYCGVGNIRMCLLSADAPRQRMESRPGVVGWNLPTPQVRSAPVEAGQLVVVHSDGIESRWAHSPPPALLSLPAELLPAALAHRHRRSRDDATALTLTVPR
ncbi:SpoIIE family protein phosphatase [Streptomyces zhihengii]|uniref:SpoIIE family protein phosphatase n=1 Tax=Streptomyces zhihengii TaxID=1818004 RepID=UPI001FD50F1D|nr:SpoIIE family protein phosphatase [Streptomyces zhihengii]